jgi:ATP-binding cassette, subfamily B, bacterial
VRGSCTASLLIPGFAGETHFAFLSHALIHQQTPARREMDYLRVVGASRQSAKKLKLFQLKPFLLNRYFKLAGETHQQTLHLARRRLLIGSFLSLLGVCG